MHGKLAMETARDSLGTSSRFGPRNASGERKGNQGGDADGPGRAGPGEEKRVDRTCMMDSSRITACGRVTKLLAVFA